MISASCKKSLEEKVFSPFHTAGISFAPFVIVSEKVKQTMDKKYFNLAARDMPGRTRLFAGAGNGDDDIAENMRLNMGEIPFSARKRKNISRLVPAPVSAVQGAHGAVADKRYTQFGVRKTDALQQVREFFREQARGQLLFPLVVFYPDIHRAFSLRTAPYRDNRSGGGKFR